MVDDGQTGRLVAPGDVPALTDALDELCRDPAWRERSAAPDAASWRPIFPRRTARGNSPRFSPDRSRGTPLAPAPLPAGSGPSACSTAGRAATAMGSTPRCSLWRERCLALRLVALAGGRTGSARQRRKPSRWCRRSSSCPTRWCSKASGANVPPTLTGSKVGAAACGGGPEETEEFLLAARRALYLHHHWLAVASGGGASARGGAAGAAVRVGAPDAGRGADGQFFPRAGRTAERGSAGCHPAAAGGGLCRWLGGGRAQAGRRARTGVFTVTTRRLPRPDWHRWADTSADSSPWGRSGRLSCLRPFLLSGGGRISLAWLSLALL